MISQKLSQEPEDYTTYLGYIRQIKKINQHGLGSFTQGSHLSFFKSNHTFADQYLAKIYDNKRPVIVKFYKNNKQNTHLIFQLFELFEQLFERDRKKLIAGTA